MDLIFKNEYIITMVGNDATAIRKDIALVYCRDIWIEHGIKGIFAPIFDVINPLRT